MRLHLLLSHSFACERDVPIPIDVYFSEALHSNFWRQLMVAIARVANLCELF
ncbi:MAG: hypothetical protein FE78DRAFT_279081 [Acidomyces sp. 'richmondensis']|nr:MAG: hypothetical protein FE78DRAFT_279081 [Acidomyces sp. 'richmondensis']